MMTTRQRLFALFLSSLLVPPTARADENASTPAFSLKGFGTFGIAHNSTDGAEFRRDYLQPRGVADGGSAKIDSRLGLQLNASFSDKFDGALQAVSRYNPDGNFAPELTWGFLAYAPNADLRVRAGRLGWDVYLLADSRDVGYSYLWVRPPVDAFGLLLLNHFDGGDLVYQRQLAGGVVSAKLYGGVTDQELPTPIGPNFDLGGSTLAGVNLGYRRGDWLFRAGYTKANVAHEVPGLIPLIGALRASGFPTAVELGNDLAFAGKSIDFVSASGAWDHGAWQAQFMYNHLSTGTLVSPTEDSGYFLLGYRHTRWNPFLSISGIAAHTDNRQTGFPLPNPLDDAIAAVTNGSRGSQMTLSVGIRYDFMQNADLKFQVDRSHVFDHDATLWTGPKADWDGNATILSITLDFIF